MSTGSTAAQRGSTARQRGRRPAEAELPCRSARRPRLTSRLPAPPGPLPAPPGVQPFGPVLPIIRVKSEEEAVEHVNANRLALQVRPLPVLLLEPVVACCLFSLVPVVCCSLRGAAAGVQGFIGTGRAAGWARVVHEDGLWCSCMSPTPAPGAPPRLPPCLPAAVPPQGCVFTQDVSRAMYISDAMETGSVQVRLGLGGCLSQQQVGREVGGGGREGDMQPPSWGLGVCLGSSSSGWEPLRRR